MNIKDAFEIVKPLNAETLLSSHPADVRLSTLDVVVDVEPYAPPSQRYSAIDRRTYDGEGKWNIIGRGATKREAVNDLLDRLEDMK